MAKGLYISATRTHAGKNMLTVGIGLRLQKEDVNIGYMKPVGLSPTEKDGVFGDETALFAQDVLGLSEAPQKVTPVLMTQDFRMRVFSGQAEDPLPVLAQAYNDLAKGRDLMIVAGSGHALSSKYCGLDSIRLVRELGIKAVIVDRPDPDLSYDILSAYKEALGEALLGVVLNDIPPSFMSEVDGVSRPFLERSGISVLGVLPRAPLMGAVRAHELAAHLGGRLVTAHGRADGMVEKFLIGTMQVENFMTYFRRHPGAAVIVGGDRADVQLVAIEGNCPCLVLTGNLFPNDIILSRAETLNIPVVMVREDTYTVARKMEYLLARHKMNDIIKVRQGSQLVSNNLDFDALRLGLGL